MMFYLGQFIVGKKLNGIYKMFLLNKVGTVSVFVCEI